MSKNTNNSKESTFNTEKLEKLKSTEVSSLDKSKLVNLNDIDIKTSLPFEERLLTFMDDIKNPYCFYVDDVLVTVNFTNKTEDMADRILVFLDSVS